MSRRAPADPFLTDILGRLFPEASDASEASAASGGPGRLRLVVLPSLSAPRYLLPTRPRRSAARMVGRQMMGGRLRTRVARGLLVAVLLGGFTNRRWPPTVSVRTGGPNESILDWLARRLQVPEVIVSVALGRPRANRKPVLQVADPEGRVLAFAKVGHNELTRRLVHDEAGALDTLSTAGLTLVEVPELRARESWRDLELLLMSALPLPEGTVTGTISRSLLHRSVLEIAGVGGIERARWSEHQFRARLAGGLTELAELGQAVGPLRQALDELDDNDPVLAFGAWHGDLNPGNLAVVGDRVLVWDWERFDSAVPVGFDLLHHDLQDAVTVRADAPDESARTLVARAPDLLAPLGVSADGAPAVVRAYLLWLAVRLLRDRQREAGAVLGRVEDWLTPALAVRG
jgi:hypothetical protein